MNKKKRNIWIGSLLAVAFILLISGGVIYYYFFAKAFSLPQSTYLYIDTHDNADSVYAKLCDITPSRQRAGFKWLARYNDYAGHIRTGRYAIYPGDNIYRVYRRLSTGRQTPVRFSFNSIRTPGKFAAVAGKQLMIDSADIASRLHDSLFCARLGFKPETVISMFIPNTYELYWNIGTDDFFKRMQKEYHLFWNDKRRNQAKAIGLTPEEVATLASIVEEETNNPAEKPMVAGLYMNRLHRDIPLQADPTVKFGLQDFGLKRILNNHLRVNSPYNTYIYKGLPPGPIRIPSIQGIESVLNYTRHDYIYMCAKEDFSGTHRFASTYAEHQRNAKKYWKALNGRKIF